MDIKEISLHQYTLKPLSAPNRLSAIKPRKGALLRVKFDKIDHFGYADLFSWPELGDPTIEELIESLKAHPYRQAAASLAWANYEAKAKQQGVSLINQTQVKNHKTMTELCEIEDFYSHAKIKITSLAQYKEVLNFVKGNDKIFRFDFNGLLQTKDEATHYSIPSHVDFIEDPFMSSLMEDESALKLFKCQIAVDKDETPKKIKLSDVWVVKPVYYSPEYLLEQIKGSQKRIVITSNMDHPLGQIIALHVAQHLPRETHGLLTQHVYETHAHSDWISQDKNILLSQGQGAGWGLDSQFETLNWTRLC